MITLQRHELGPRLHVLGRRVHEWHVGAAVIAVAVGTDAAGRLTDLAAAALLAVGAWLVAKDWRDIFPSTRDTAAWRPILHARVCRLRLSRRGEGLPGVAAAVAAAAGLVNLASALTPNIAWRRHLLLQVEPLQALPVFHALALPASACLIVTAFYLARRRRRALHAALAFLILLGVFDLLKGLDVEEALLSWLVAGLLWWGRDAFYVRHDPIRLRGPAWRLPALGLGAFGLAALACLAADPAGSASALVRSAGDLLLWHPAPIRFADEFGWVPLAGGLLGLLALLGSAYVAFRPLAVPRGLPGPDLRRAAADLVHRHGSDTLSYFKLRRDTQYLFSPDRSAFAGYRIDSGVLLVAGDPVGPEGRLPALVRALCGHAETHGLDLAVLGASEGTLPLWREAGLRTLYLGDEAIVDTSAFSLEGRTVRKVRQSVSRLERAGYTAELLDVASLDARTVADLERVSSIWRGDAAERGFSMAMDSVRCAEHCDGTVVVARDADGSIRGYVHFVPSAGRRTMSLSSMRRERETPNGLMEFLVVRSIELMRSRGVAELSLNFAAFARFMHDPRTRCERVVGRLARLAGAHFQIESLYRFNAKFLPRWEPRYLVFERTRRLPRVGLAALWIEGQLPKPLLRHR